MLKRVCAILLALVMILSLSATVLGGPIGGPPPSTRPPRPQSMAILGGPGGDPLTPATAETSCISILPDTAYGNYC